MLNKKRRSLEYKENLEKEKVGTAGSKIYCWIVKGRSGNIGKFYVDPI